MWLWLQFIVSKFWHCLLSVWYYTQPWTFRRSRRSQRWRYRSTTVSKFGLAKEIAREIGLHIARWKYSSDSLIGSCNMRKWDASTVFHRATFRLLKLFDAYCKRQKVVCVTQCYNFKKKALIHEATINNILVSAVEERRRRAAARAAADRARPPAAAVCGASTPTTHPASRCKSS